uniref:Uncharacterized protein n=1 Tax=Cacopsylla melanoneura TaxID=428564 RepID=A0A8D8QVV2_9HEMI
MSASSRTILMMMGLCLVLIVSKSLAKETQNDDFEEDDEDEDFEARPSSAPVRAQPPRRPFQQHESARNPQSHIDPKRLNCPLCDSSVYSYCSDKLLHDACCCLSPSDTDDLPPQCGYADCSFLHANTCREHRLITACCCNQRL